MDEPIHMPAVHIPLEHQSTPKEHAADKAIKEAAREIDEGKWSTDDQSEQRDAVGGMGLALGLGQDSAALGEKPALEEFRQTYEQNQILDQLGRHPQVVEALAKMRLEVDDRSKGHDLIEQNCALRELTAASERGNRWDGQGRWIGLENEEMRHGKLLSPPEFFEQLEKVIGKDRLMLSEHLTFLREDRKSAMSGIYKHNPMWDGSAHLIREGKRTQARAMEDEAKKLQFEVKLARSKGNEDKARRKMRECAKLAFEAIDILTSCQSEQAAAEPEYYRVAAIQWPVTTEWMIVNFTEWGTVWNPRYYGWRTSLLQLIKEGAVTEVEAHHAFPLEPGPAADWYEEQIYKFNHGAQALVN